VKIGYWFFWAFITSLLVASAWLCFEYLPMSAFRDNFLGDWFATIIGAIVGIPIALWLSRKQQKEQEKQEQLVREQEALTHKGKILKLIRTELEYNLDQLRASKTETNGVPKRVVFLNGLKDELWNAFSDGGELQWIKDLQSMHMISYAYHYIRRVIYLEKLYMEIKRPRNWANAPAEELVGHLLEIDPVVIEAIEQALEEIDKKLESLDIPTFGKIRP
jgi:hypothetical protein